MIYNLYLIYKTYNVIVHLYGIYVAMSFGYTYLICSYFMGFFKIEQPQKQLCDVD